MATCESCGRDGETVTKVQRIYLADTGTGPQAIDQGSPPVAGEIELWCASCCATFPHVAVETD